MSGRCRNRNLERRREDRLRLILIQRCAALTAKIVGGFKLDEMALVASHHFPGIYRRESRGHSGCASARAGTTFNSSVTLRHSSARVNWIVGLKPRKLCKSVNRTPTRRKKTT